VAQTPQGWVMIFIGTDWNTRGVAFSADGIHWSASQANPIIEKADIGSSSNGWDAALVYFNDQLMYFFEIGGNASTNIYMLYRQAPLLPWE
jgi:hypothetical protein